MDKKFNINNKQINNFMTKKKKKKKIKKKKKKKKKSVAKWLNKKFI